VGTRVLIVIASLAVIALIVGAVFVLQGGAVAPASSPASSVAASPGAGLVVTDEVIGTGAEAKADSTVTAKYTGMLADGTVFDASERHDPNGLEFSLSGGVIKGWQEGIPGMKVGGKRKLVIPPDLGYGAQAKEGIPPNSTLTFEVELVGVK